MKNLIIVIVVYYINKRIVESMLIFNCTKKIKFNDYHKRLFGYRFKLSISLN